MLLHFSPPPADRSVSLGLGRCPVRLGMTRGRAGREAGREGKSDTTGEFDRGGEEAVTNVKGVPRGTVRRP